jgi:integrase
MKFICRRSSGSDRGGNLYVRIIYRREVKQWSLDCRLREGEWDDRRQQVILPRRDAERRKFLLEVSAKISRFIAVFYLVVGDLERSGQPFCLKELYEAFLLRENENNLRTYAEELAVKLRQNGQIRTARAYGGAAAAIVRFNGGELLLDELTPDLIESFEDSMQRAGRSLNTTSHYMRTLQVICNKAFKEKKMKCPADELFRDVFTGVAPTPKRALPENALIQLLSLDIPRLMALHKPGGSAWRRLQGLYTAWRLFAFSFYACGMCFVDICYLKKEHISAGRISYRRKKTGQNVNITITEQIQFLIDSFADETAGSPYVFPLLRENGGDLYRQYENALRTNNRRLKHVADLAGLDSIPPLTSHAARHSWASRGKNKFISIAVLAALLGHSSEKTTRIYLASFDQDILAEANSTITKGLPIPAQMKRMAATG